MDQRNLEVILISAKDLNKVNWMSRMAVYATVSLSAEPRTKQRTPVDRDGGRNPTWNHAARFSVPENPEHGGQLFLHVSLRASRFLRDRAIGDVRVPIKELLAGAEECPQQEKYISYEVRRFNSGKPKGVLTFSYKLGERIAQAGQAPAGQTQTGQTPAGQTPSPASAYPPAVADPYPHQPPQTHDKEPRGRGSDEPVMAYPAYSPGAYPGYQHPPQYGYGPPPHQGYAYHPSAGYGYGQVAVMQPPPQRKSR